MFLKLNLNKILLIFSANIDERRLVFAFGRFS